MVVDTRARPRGYCAPAWKSPVQSSPRRRAARTRSRSGSSRTGCPAGAPPRSPSFSPAARRGARAARWASHTPMGAAGSSWVSARPSSSIPSARGSSQQQPGPVLAKRRRTLCWSCRPMRGDIAAGLVQGTMLGTTASICTARPSPPRRSPIPAQAPAGARHRGRSGPRESRRRGADRGRGRQPRTGPSEPSRQRPDSRRARQYAQELGREIPALSVSVQGTEALLAAGMGAFAAVAQALIRSLR